MYHRDKNKELLDYLQSFLGAQSESFIDASPETRAIRVNTLKSCGREVRLLMKRLNISFDTLGFNKNGYTVYDPEKRLSHSLSFFEGQFQYQGIASQIPALVLAPKATDRVADMAAAPGSKATQLADLMQNQGVLVLNDSSRSRLQALNANIQRAGAINQIMLNLPGERFGTLFPEFFDKILLDAPCSALGTLPNNKEIYHWWRYGRMQKIRYKQEQLIISALKALKPGGVMVYSTCSIAPEENECLLSPLLERYPIRVETVELPGLICEMGVTHYRACQIDERLSNAIRTYPHLHNMEGFFIIKMTKTDSIQRPKAAAQGPDRPTFPPHDKTIKSVLREISRWWGIPDQVWESYRYILTSRRLWLVAKEIEAVPNEGFTSAGLLLAEQKQPGWKLFNQSVQFLGEHIEARRLRLSRNQMQNLFANGFAEVSSGVPNGYYAAVWQNKPFASLYVENKRARMKRPHRFHLQI